MSERAVREQAMSKRVVLFGAPGAGKGTQAALLATRWGVPHVATGDAFRRAVAAGTELGQLARGYMERGELVPDEIVNGVVAERLGEPDSRQGFILDGYPRTVAQAEALATWMGARDWHLTAVVDLVVPEEELVQRAAGRRVCRQCGANYHLRYRPPQREGHCDVCGGELMQRADDRPETVRQRLQVYRRQTEPVLGYYRSRGLLVVVDGSGPVPEVTEAILQAVAEKDMPGGPGGTGRL